MNRLAAIAFTVLIICGCTPDEAVRQGPASKSASQVNLQTDDLDRFWIMYDRERPLFTPAEVNRHYLQDGSHVLQRFFAETNVSASILAGMLNTWEYRQYLDDIRPVTRTLSNQQQEVRKALQQLYKLYPEAVFTDIALVMGAFDTGGAVLQDGRVVIAAEMVSGTDSTETKFMSPWLRSAIHKPSFLPVIAVHEMVHLQQRRYSITHNGTTRGRTLLDRALLEGAADFITEKITGRYLSQHLEAYVDSNQTSLWNQFQSQMYQNNLSGWLYNGLAPRDRPADLGYLIGYRIVASYFRTAKNKEAAIQAIIEMEDSRAFLERSGYNGQSKLNR